MKPKLTVLAGKLKIAVIAKTRVAFDRWLKEQGLTVADAIYVDGIERARGFHFVAMELVGVDLHDPEYRELIATVRERVRVEPDKTVGETTNPTRSLYPIELRAEAAWMLKTNNHALAAHALLLRKVADAFEALEEDKARLECELAEAKKPHAALFVHVDKEAKPKPMDRDGDDR